MRESAVPGNPYRMADNAVGTARNETPVEGDDREFAEILQELRVTQTGVQILFAFMLTLAFTPRFPPLDAVQRGTYVTTLLLSVLTAALFITPAALHRWLFQRGAKAQIVTVSSWLVGAGLRMLALSLTGAVLLVVDVVWGRPAGIGAGATTLALCTGLWALLPWLIGRGPRLRRPKIPDARHEPESDPDPGR